MAATMGEYLKKVDPDAEDMLVAARAILAVAVDTNKPLNENVIAMATGLTVDTVRDILNSPVYQQLISDQVRFLVTGTLVRGVKALGRIIDSDQSTDANTIAATRGVTHLCQVIQQSMPNNQGNTGDEKLNKVLELIESRNNKGA